MPGARGGEAMTEAIAEAVEAVDALNNEAPAEAVVVTPSSSGGGDMNIYMVMLAVGAVAYLFAMLVFLLWLKEYSHPDQFWF